MTSVEQILLYTVEMLQEQTQFIQIQWQKLIAITFVNVEPAYRHYKNNLTLSAVEIKLFIKLNDTMRVRRIFLAWKWLFPTKIENWLGKAQKYVIFLVAQPLRPYPPPPSNLVAIRHSFFLLFRFWQKKIQRNFWLKEPYLDVILYNMFNFRLGTK